MRAFRVEVNGKRICLAGVEKPGVLTAIAAYVEGERGTDLDLSVGGLLTATNEHVSWARRKLKNGDKIAITIIEASSVDKPKEQYRVDPRKEKRQKMAYVRAMAKELGWKLTNVRNSQ